MKEEEEDVAELLKPASVTQSTDILKQTANLDKSAKSYGYKSNRDISINLADLGGAKGPRESQSTEDLETQLA